MCSDPREKEGKRELGETVEDKEKEMGKASEWLSEKVCVYEGLCVKPVNAPAAPTAA